MNLTEGSFGKPPSLAATLNQTKAKVGIISSEEREGRKGKIKGAFRI